MRKRIILPVLIAALVAASSVSVSAADQTVDQRADVITSAAAESSTDGALYASTGFVNCSKAYTLLNKFRTTKKVWQWKPGNKSKQYFNTKKSNTLSELKRDAALEKTAKKRAKEIAKSFSHTRPNGKTCFSIYPSKFSSCGENIAAGYATPKAVTEGWKETNFKYEGQGHRRNMLSKDFTSVGIACYQVNGYKYWVQCFGG